jgi:Flp pilus assembly protein TadD/peroxiredoxin
MRFLGAVLTVSIWVDSCVGASIHLAEFMKTPRTPPRAVKNRLPSRRTFLKTLGYASALLRPAAFTGTSFLGQLATGLSASALPFADVRLLPHYPAKSALDEVLRRVPPGSDEFVTERYAYEIDLLLRDWSRALRASPQDSSTLAKSLDPAIASNSLTSAAETPLRSSYGIDCKRRRFGLQEVSGSENFLAQLRSWLGGFSQIVTAEFQITGIEEVTGSPLKLQLDIRYDLVGLLKEGNREERVGTWTTEWRQASTRIWTATRWQATGETVSVASQPAFIDVTRQALGATDSYHQQLLPGVDHWRTVLDGACGIDVYGNNGLAAGDYDNDGFDDLYICQPAGLPNRLYRNRRDGTFEDVTEKAGVGVLDGTACALFADFRNLGLQDLLVVCGTGPLLFLNRGDGTFAIKRDAFQFQNPPQGTFTHAALSDYDRDGRLDIYFCLYSYYVGLDQYHYPVPYYDARNGPPNFLMHNRGDGVFLDRTRESGLNAENNRYSFAAAWGASNAKGLPDLYVANDFGRNNLYRNNGDGTFAAISGEARIQDVGAGMSACWSDCDNDGKQDIYVSNMWSAAGQRVSGQALFQPKASEEIRALYRRHARGNALYRNRGDGKFENVGTQAGVEMGRWAWSSDLWDFDHDGYPDLYVANGYISAPDRDDLGSFFWRQVVARSPNDDTPTAAYEQGWQALNELIRSDRSWSGYERNVLFANHRDGTFSEVSGVVGLDFPEDSRSFVLADLDRDGRLEVVLKNRNAPQLRVLHNAMKELGDSIAFRLRGHASNRDAIGAAITVECGSLRQTRYLQAGTGFLAQHSKELFFGLGKPEAAIHATIQWPSGLSQRLDNLPANHRIAIEEANPTPAVTPFATTSAAYETPGPTAAPPPLPSEVETWLLQPVKAPDFSSPGLDGKPVELSSFRGGFVLLQFWSTQAPFSLEQLQLLKQNMANFAAHKLTILALNLDSSEDRQKAGTLCNQEHFGFPILFATEDIAGTYNIVYRYLFDRRRDLPIPSAFLLDSDGMIVKVYQGSLDPLAIREDLKQVPVTASDRMKKALPFPGNLYQSSFQRNDFTYGVAMFQHGYFDRAAESFQQVVAAKPGDAEGYYNLGTLSLRRNDFPQARQYLEQTVKLRPTYPEAWNNLGMTAAHEGHPEEAVEDFQRSLQLRPGYETALLNLGNVYRRQGLFDKALESLTHALQLQPDDPEVNYSLGMLYAQQSQMDRAADYLRKAIDLRPAYPEAINNLGVLFVRERDYARAEEQFKTGIRLAPNYDQLYLNLARLYAIQNATGPASEVLRQLLRLQPHNAAASKALEALK